MLVHHAGRACSCKSDRISNQGDPHFEKWVLDSRARTVGFIRNLTRTHLERSTEEFELVTVRTTPDPSNNDILDNDYMKIEELWSLYGETNGDDHIVNLQVVLKQQKT